MRYGPAMRWMLIVLVALAACKSRSTEQQPSNAPAPPGAVAKTADDCELFFKKARSTMQKMAAANGMSMTPSIEEQGIADCRTDVKAGIRNKLIDCVLEAKDQAGVDGCFPKFEDLTMPKQPGSGSGS